jgi:predicted extracellular nuclease
MFYNCENFFDSDNDLLTADDEFTPSGLRHWTLKRFQDKTNRLAKVIVAAGKWNLPILVGLCEVENHQVLEKLTKSSTLAAFNYQIVHRDSPDKRGIDVALIYRPDLFKPFDYRVVPVTDPLDSLFTTRDILEVSGVLNACDTLAVYVNHWPSKYGGIMETKSSRNLAAAALRNAIAERLAQMPGSKIVCMGDFNDTPEDESISRVLQARPVGQSSAPDELINLSFPWMNEPVQTIKSGYSWQTFDQWIVSANFVRDTACIHAMKVEIFRPEFLLEPDHQYGGVKPFRTYAGYRFQDGFSDHLPIVLRVRLN